MRALACGSLAVAAAIATGCVEPAHQERRWSVMGTYASAEVYMATDRGAEEILEEIRIDFDHVDAVMSNWKQDSEIHVLNREAAKGPSVVQDPDLWRCIKLSLELARLTEGRFDPTVGPLVRLWGFRPRDPRVPSEAEIAEALTHVGWRKVERLDVTRGYRFLDPGVEIDLGGIAKGYALDIAVRNFARPGSRAGLLDLGGNLYAWGAPPGEDGWRVALRDPDDPERAMATVVLRDRAVSTSGAYENAFVAEGRTWHHLLDPVTGRPADSDVISATAFADSGAQADALSTAMFVAGSARTGRILSKFVRIEGVLLVRREEGIELLASAALRGKLELDPDFAPKVGGRIRYLLPPLSIQPTLEEVLPSPVPAGG